MDPIQAFSQSPIKGSFVSHFMLVTCALTTLNWMPNVFLMYNSVFFFCLLWSLQSAHNPEPVQLAVIINLFSILLDIMSMATNYSYNNYRDWFGFSIFLLICNLLLRPITSIILLRIHNERSVGSFMYSGNDVGGLGTGSGIATFNGYQNLDRPSFDEVRPLSSHSKNNATMPYQVSSHGQSTLIDIKQ